MFAFEKKTLKNAFMFSSTFKNYFLAIWTPWSAFDRCSVSCGGGVSTRRRLCMGRGQGGKIKES